jgi:hypothetical protein
MGITYIATKIGFSAKTKPTTGNTTTYNKPKTTMRLYAVKCSE